MPVPTRDHVLNKVSQRIARAIWPKASQLPDDVFIELVHLLFTGLLPVIFMGAATSFIGILIYGQTRDFTLLCLVIASTLVTLARILCVLAYRQRLAAQPLTRAEASDWEFRYAIGSFMFAILLGAFGARALTAANPLVPMLITGLTFGYGAGVVSRYSVRPIICVTSMVFAAIPIVTGFVLHGLTAAGFFNTAAYGAQAFLVAGFAIASLETVAHTYRTTVQQLHTQQDLAALAGHDALTGLANRILLRAHFNEGAAAMRRSGDLMAVFCLDLDKFKPVNDMYGHPTGDILLHALAQRLDRTLQAGDTAARTGGDEFVVIQNSIRNADEARLLARRIIRVISAPYNINGQDIRIGVSVGVAVNANEGLDLDQLVARADAALYQAKRDKTSQLVFWDDITQDSTTSSAA